MTGNEFKLQILPVVDKAIEASLATTRIMFTLAEDLHTLFFSAARDAVSEAAHSSHSLFDVRNLQDLTAVQRSLAQAGTDRVLSAPRGAFDISMRAAAELRELLNAQAIEVNKAATDLAQKTIAFQQGIHSKARR